MEKQIVISVGRSAPVSLLDAINRYSVDYYVVFRTIPRERTLFWRLLKPGFYHVEVWGYVPPGAWIRFDTSIELVSVEVYADPPWVLIGPEENPTFLRYRALVPHGHFRQRWFTGPLTCVVLAAAFLGVRLPFWCRTPYQLFKRLKKLNGSQS